MEECEGAEGKVKQSMTPPSPPSCQGSLLGSGCTHRQWNILDGRGRAEPGSSLR